MRSFPWIICIPLVLLAGCAARYSEPEAVQTSLASPTWAVKGYGETGEDARQRALEKARDSVEDYLEKRYPSIGWRPTVENLLAQSVVKVDEPTPSALDLSGLGAAGELSGAPLTSPITAFHLTNPIARASVTMAECAALVAGAQKLAAE